MNNQHPAITPYHDLTLCELAGLIRTRQTTSEAVTRATLERIAALDSHYHAYVTVMQESALEAAREADREIAAGRYLGTLHGVPLAVKDLFNVEGVPVTHGMPIHAGRIAPDNATVITRLRAAGAVILGKLQLTESAFCDHHPDVKTPVSPWGVALWPGASSSGSGVAVAAGLSFGTLGTDTGGSIRYPSAVNGITGLKPTWGRVSRYGAHELAASLDHIGTMARTAQDAAALLQAIAGYDPFDVTTSGEPVPDYSATLCRSLQGVKVGFDPDWALLHTDEHTRGALLDAITTLEALGAELVAVTMPDTDQAAQDWPILCGIEAAAAHADTFPARAEEYGASLRGLLELGNSLTAVEANAAQVRRLELRGRMNHLFTRVNLILSPSCAVSGLTVEQMDDCGNNPELLGRLLRYTSPFDISGHPSITLPAGVAPNGAPLSFQLIGREWGEAELLNAGYQFQLVTDWHHRRPTAPE